MDEPESRAYASLAALEGLDNLTFVVNCNLQRLDGPVRGNGKIIQELESYLPRRRLERDQGGVGPGVGRTAARRSRRRPGESDEHHPDGDYQTFKANDGAFVREHFFGRDPRTRIWSRTSPTNRSGGGISNAAATTTARCMPPTPRRWRTRPADGDPGQDHQGLHTRQHFEGRNATHQMKKLTLDDLRFPRQYPDPDHRRPARRESVPAAVLPPRAGRPEIKYMLDRRKSLGGFLPSRRTTAKPLHPDVSRALKTAGKGRANSTSPPPWHWSGSSGSVARQGDRPPHRTDHPRRGTHLRMDSWFPDAQDLQPQRAAVHLGRRRPLLAYKESARRARSCTRASTRTGRRPRSSRSAPRTPRTTSR